MNTFLEAHKAGTLSFIKLSRATTEYTWHLAQVFGLFLKYFLKPFLSRLNAHSLQCWLERQLSQEEPNLDRC